MSRRGRGGLRVTGGNGPGFKFEAKFGDIILDVTSTSTTHGRAVVTHSYPKRDGADLEDMGREPRVITMEFIFVDHEYADEQEGDYEERFRAWQEAMGTGWARVLVHPYEGSVTCRVSGWSHHADAELVAIICNATFTEEIASAPVLEPGLLGQTRTGAVQVAAVALSADASLADAGFDAATANAARSKVAACSAAAGTWETDPTLSPRDVQMQMASLNQQLSENLVALDAARDVASYPIVRDYTLLQYNLRRCAESFTSETTRTVTITVTEPTPLRVVAARYYGATEADQRVGELRQLNPALKGVLLVPAGSQLLGYAK